MCIVATSFFQQTTAAFELFFIERTYTSDILFQKNKSLKYMHRGQTYLTASHSQLHYFCIHN